MTINKTVTIKLTENEIKSIIADYLISKGYAVDCNSICMSYNTNLLGIGKYITATANIKE